MKVKISADSLHATEITGTKRNRQFNIKFLSNDGDDISTIARVGAKSYWFTKDNPQYAPNSIREAELQDDGTVIIIWREGKQPEKKTARDMLLPSTDKFDAKPKSRFT